MLVKIIPIFDFQIVIYDLNFKILKNTFYEHFYVLVFKFDNYLLINMNSQYKSGGVKTIIVRN